MARVDLNHTNGWIPEQEGPVLERVRQVSAVEALAKKVQMTTDLARLKGVSGADPRIVAEGALIPDATLSFRDEVLEAYKWAEILPLSYEDVSDSTGAIIEEYKTDWFAEFAAKYDNAALGVTAAKGTTAGTLADRPFNSVYYVASQAGNVLQTAGAVTLDDLNDSLGSVESSGYFAAERGVIIAHPSLKASLRVLKDAQGNPVFTSGQAVSGQVGDTLFGYRIQFSTGARTSAVMDASPTGNPLMIFADRNNLIAGVRSGPESVLSTEVDFKTDVYNLKVRARRGFIVTNPESLAVVEITSA